MGARDETELELRGELQLAPVDLRRVEFRRTVRGYDPEQVDGLLQTARASYEALWRRAFDLKLELEELREELQRRRADEDLIRDALMSAQRTAEEIRTAADERAQALVTDSRKDADELLAAARAERDQILAAAQAKADELVQSAERERATAFEEVRTQLTHEREEARRLAALRSELEAGYKAFLLAALELLESHRVNGSALELLQASAAASTEQGAEASADAPAGVSEAG